MPPSAAVRIGSRTKGSIVTKVAIAIGAMLTVAGPGHAQKPTTHATHFAQRVAGCYEIRPGSWQTDSELPDLKTWPTRFRLTATRLAGWEQWQSDTLPLYRVTEFPVGIQVRDSVRFWQRVSVASDSVLVTVPMVLSGLGFVFRVGGTSSGGYAFAETDMIRPDRPSRIERPIVVRRVACPPR